MAGGRCPAPDDHQLASAKARGERLRLAYSTYEAQQPRRPLLFPIERDQIRSSIETNREIFTWSCTSPSSDLTYPGGQVTIVTLTPVQPSAMIVRDMHSFIRLIMHRSWNHARNRTEPRFPEKEFHVEQARHVSPSCSSGARAAAGAHRDRWVPGQRGNKRRSRLSQ